MGSVVEEQLYNSVKVPVKVVLLTMANGLGGALTKGRANSFPQGKELFD